MARKHNVKVRSGCRTCKIRRVKCDEGKPHCNRCTQTGRKCDGYAHIETVAVAHQPRRLFPSCAHSSEARALQFFRTRAAAGLSGPYDCYFWANLVLQLSNTEPVVRHAVIAVSSLYEDLACRGKEISGSNYNAFAISHYNAAVRKLRDVRHEPLVLVVCLLFICIEVLQENRAQAITHCQHGIMILKSIRSTALWSQDYLAPIFQRLASLPILFGKGASLQLLSPTYPMPSSFSSFEEANYFIEDIVTRTLELSHNGDVYRFGPLWGQPVRPDLLAMQAELRNSIRSLKPALARLLQQESSIHQPLSVDKKIRYLLFELRVEISTIWAAVSLEPNETAYDRFSNRFRHMTRLAKCLAAATEQRGASSGPDFRFDIGHLMLIHGIVIKCRTLAVRLEALDLIRTYGPVKESFWNSKNMYQVDRRAIEIEHELMLDVSDQPIVNVAETDIPREWRRILHTNFNPEIVTRLEVNGKHVTGSPLGFVIRDAEQNLYVQNEFIFVTSADHDNKAQFMKLDSSQIQPYFGQFDSTDMKCPLI